jgi:hypothetical protein
MALASDPKGVSESETGRIGIVGATVFRPSRHSDDRGWTAR